uniref:Uncharacterized protein n=1 Tax=Cacopsylla melanoneura TaxID=428564 RepID=A0A8D8SG69_9HEMI
MVHWWHPHIRTDLRNSINEPFHAKGRGRIFKPLSKSGGTIWRRRRRMKEDDEEGEDDEGEDYEEGEEDEEEEGKSRRTLNSIKCVKEWMVLIMIVWNWIL